MDPGSKSRRSRGATGIRKNGILKKKFPEFGKKTFLSWIPGSGFFWFRIHVLDFFFPDSPARFFRGRFLDFWKSTTPDEITGPDSTDPESVTCLKTSNRIETSNWNPEIIYEICGFRLLSVGTKSLQIFSSVLVTKKTTVLNPKRKLPLPKHKGKATCLRGALLHSNLIC